MITVGQFSYLGNVHERFEPEVYIGKFCSIASDVMFLGCCQHPQTVSTFPFTDKGWSDDYPKTFSRGPITIGNDVWIGEDALILDGVSIGDGAVVGARAVVSRDVAPYSVVVGSPLVSIKNRFPLEIIEKLLQIKWWDWPEEHIKQAIPDMTDIHNFIQKYYKEAP